MRNSSASQTPFRFSKRSVISLDMVCAVVLVALVFLVQGTSAANWALLVAGSTGYGNYRHQADVCHAYQVLKNHGFPESNIIVMMKDDVANSYRNPVKGIIIVVVVCCCCCCYCSL